MASPEALIIYAAAEGIRTLVELMADARKYPNMTEAEADQLVSDTVNRAQKTLADWRAFRST